MKSIFILLIRVYQLCFSPFIGTCCRFAPSCSEYAKEAIETFGAFKGTWLAIKRLAKCGPWHRGGYDPVPTNLSFGLSSSDSEEFTKQILGFSTDANGQRPFARGKSTRDASKFPEGEGEKPKTQVTKAEESSMSCQVESQSIADD